MWIKLVCVVFLCLASSSDIVESIRWQHESSPILKSLGLNPSLSLDIEGSVSDDDDDDDDDLGFENFNLIEGDIIPDELDIKDRSSVIKKTKLWPKGRIPYVISSTLNDRRNEIKNAMKYIQNVTCLRFVHKTIEPNYIRIFKGKGCNSKVGMSGGLQNVSLGPGCYKTGKIMHELLHAAGFYHEHSRSDRDNYIYVHWENIQKGHERNFVKNKPAQERLLTPYDYQSIMHYSSFSFSKDKARGLKTMTAKKEGVVLTSPGDRMLSRSDIKRISILYNCAVTRSYSFPQLFYFPRLFPFPRLYSYFG